MLVQNIVEYNQFLQDSCSENELKLLTLKAAVKTQFLVRHDVSYRNARSLLKNQPDVASEHLTQPVGNLLLPEFTEAEYRNLDTENTLINVTRWLYENFSSGTIRQPITEMDPVFICLFGLLSSGLASTSEEAGFRLSTMIAPFAKRTPKDLRIETIDACINCLNLRDLSEAAESHLKQAQMVSSSVTHRLSYAFLERISNWLMKAA